MGGPEDNDKLVMLEASAAKSAELTKTFQKGQDAMAKTVAQLRLESETSNVHRGGSGSAAEQSRGLFSRKRCWYAPRRGLPITRTDMAEKRGLAGNRESWRSNNGVRMASTRHTDLRRMYRTSSTGVLVKKVKSILTKERKIHL